MRECSVAVTDAAWDRVKWAQASRRMIPSWNLKQSCLGKVQDILLAWSRMSQQHLEARETNPFYTYPIHLRQDLLDNLVRLRPEGRDLLRAAELLVCSGVESFDLRCLDDCKLTEMCAVLETLILNGKTLRELTIAGQWLYRDEVWNCVQRLLHSVPNLRTLRLQHTTPQGKELHTISVCCPLLSHLEILHPSVDDAEIRDLIQFLDAEPACQSIRQNLSELHLPSSVRGRGVLLTLKAFPNVERMRLAYLEEVLDDLEQQGNQTWWRRRLALVRSMHVTHPLGEDAVERLVEWCPALQDVSLEVQEGMLLISLASLVGLTSLELRNSPTLAAAYTEEVLPLLAVCGNRLLRLSLEQFDVVDLAKTAIYCPNLRALTAQWFTLLGGGAVPNTTTHHRHQPPPPFSTLRYLRIRPRSNRKVPPDVLEMLLGNCQSLRHLEIYFCPGLTDALAVQATQQNPLNNLRSLLLRHGHGLTINGVKTLISRAQKLTQCDVGAVALPDSSECGAVQVR